MSEPTRSIPRVRIVQLDPATLQALSEGDLDRAQATAPVRLSAYLVADESIGTWRFRARQAVETPQDLPWITGVLWDEAGEQAVGKAGFHAAPDADGMVEIGYAVDPAFRRQGFARAALELLLDRARREPEARVLRATVAPANAGSLALVHQYPFLETGEQWDAEDGLEIIYELPVDGPRTAAT